MQNTSVFPYFQPIISVASGKIVGYEALARQYDSEGNIVSAGAIFSSKETPIEQLRELDREVRWMALQKFSTLDDKSCYLTINISAAWIDYISNVNDLPTLDMLDKLQIDRSRVIIEITEGVANIDKLKAVVKTYRQHGLKVAIDDYGSGYSQLARVIAINPDIIKIDMGLFQLAVKGGIASDAVQSLTRFGKRQGCQIVCEGVEKIDEFLFGLDCGAQYMQGFLFSHAQSEFQDSEAYQQHITSLRKKFLSRKLSTEKKKIQRLQSIEQLSYKLKEALQDDFNLNELSTWGFEDQGILKFYLCNPEGTQISSDFNFQNNSWFSDSRQMGLNWSWRPYFYQSIALYNCGIDNQVAISESYRDHDSGLLCKTLSLSLDKDRILMIDIKNED
ncbi:MAG: EAL domain-containing protein [Methylococcaceae bacterium]|nr:EAL domain-containing protein [Methylococcaceae bacterium]